MNKILENKVAVITGAGRGIGKAIAIAYANNGARVCCISRNEKEIDNTVRYINENYGIAMGQICDVSDYKAIEASFEKIHKTFGAVDIVVINAGVDGKNSSIEETDIDTWKKVIDVNLTGAFYTAKASIPYLKKQGGGKIITIGSGLGHRGRANTAEYSCSKAGLWMLTRILAQELYESNISVNEIIPGPVVTNMGKDSMKDNKSAFSISSEWVKEPKDVTQLALFLATQPLIGPSGQSFSLMRRDL